MTNEMDTTLRRIGAPQREFWENELEIPVETVWAKIAAEGFPDRWVARQPKRLLNLLRRLLLFGGVAPTAARATGLHGQASLLPYLLVEEFFRHKSKSAAVERAAQVLPEAVLELCRKTTGDFDPLCLCFALYDHDPAELVALLCLDKAHKSGFARMRLLQHLRRPKRAFQEFLTPERVSDVLAECDAEWGDDRRGELKRILDNRGNPQVFVRRGERPDCVLRGRRVVHGHRPEWIVLEFLESARRVHIASASVGRPLQIANRIASAYFQTDCQYENENLVTYGEQLLRFLRELQADQSPDLRLVEVAVANSPLEGSPQVRIADPRSLSIGRAVGHFEEAVGTMFAAVERVQNIKVLFRGKRLLVRFEPVEQADDEFVVRYSDHRLTPTQRGAFEDYLRQFHGISALSTEKRFPRAA